MKTSKIKEIEKIYDWTPEYIATDQATIAERVERLCDLTPAERHEFLAPRDEDTITATDRFILWKNYYAKNLFFLKPSPAINYIDYLRTKTGQREQGFFETMCTTMPGTGKTTGEAVYISYRVAYRSEAEVVYQSAVSRNVKSWNPTIIKVLTSPLIIHDFGELVPEEVSFAASRTSQRMQEKSRLSFVLANGIQLTSIPVGTTIRGARSIYTEYSQKHTYLVLDDTVSTRVSRSESLKQEVKDAASEAKRSRDPGVGVIRHLTNMVQYPNIAQETIKKKEIPYLIIPATKPVIYFDGKIEYVWEKAKKTNWDAKLTLTEKEAHEKNKTRLQHEQVGSLEKEKKVLGENYKYEYECETPDRGRRIFPTFEQDSGTPVKMRRIHGMDVYYYEGWDSEAKNVLAADISLGRGGDPSVILALDEYLNVIACGQSREVHPIKLTDVIIEVSNELETSVIAPENNSMGQSVVDRLVMDDSVKAQIYREMKYDRAKQQKSPKYGFHTSQSSKEKIMSELQASINEIIANDESLISQIMEITVDDLEISKRSLSRKGRKHNFDHIICLAIANYVIKKPQVKAVLSFMGQFTREMNRQRFYG